VACASSAGFVTSVLTSARAAPARSPSSSARRSGRADGGAEILVLGAASQRDGTQLHHVTAEGLDEWIAWWDAQEASA